MYQTWGKLLFLRWPVTAERLRPLIAPGLHLDAFQGQAWVSVTPFTMWGIHPIISPSLPVLSSSHELNVRTYVHVGGVPGVWVFSPGASNALAVLGARLALGLPYLRARRRLRTHDSDTQFASTRRHRGAPAAQFEGTRGRGEPLPPPDLLDFLLVERLSFTSTMLECQGLPAPPEAPLPHAQGEPLRVGFWPPERV